MSISRNKGSMAGRGRSNRGQFRKEPAASSNGERGQATIELFAITVIFVAVFSIMYGIYQNEFSATSRRVQILTLRQVADDVSLSINSAVLQGDGYATNATLPYKIGASDFYVNVTNGVVTLTITDNKLSTASRIMTKNVTGAFLKGQNMVRNRGGVIYVN